MLYPIIDEALCRARGWSPIEAAAACLRGGARVLQLRMKGATDAEFLDLADRLVALLRPAGARLIVNDRPDIALMAGADGVHLGQDDLPAADVRRLMGPAAVIGVSTHDSIQIDEALAGPATYVAVGPIYETATKETGYDARGLDLVRRAARRGRPIVAIGGITLERAPEVLAAGADAVAVISDLLAAGDLEARTRAFLAAGPGPPFNV